MSSISDTLAKLNKDLDNAPGLPLGSQVLGSFQTDKNDNRDFFSKPINSPDIAPLIQSLLQNLGVPEAQWGRYRRTSLSVYDFLVELTKFNHIESNKLKEFLKLVEGVTRARWIKILGGSAFALIIINCLVPLLAISGKFSVFQELFAEALFLPVVGVLFTCGVFIYSIYNNHSDKKKTLGERFQENFFLLANVAVKLAAYSVVITAAATMTPIASILLVIAEIINVVKEVVKLVQIIAQDRKIASIAGLDELSQRQMHLRLKYDYLKHKYALVINTITAVLVAGISLMWTFVPGGIAVAIPAIAAIVLVHLLAMYVQKRLNTMLTKRMHEKFSEIEREHKEKQEKKSQVDLSLVETNSQQKSMEIKPSSTSVIKGILTAAVSIKERASEHNKPETNTNRKNKDSIALGCYSLFNKKDAQKALDMSTEPRALAISGIHF